MPSVFSPRPYLLAVFLMCVATPVAGQSREDIRIAKEVFGEGKKLYKAGKYAEAAAAFSKAYALSKRSELLFNIGQSYRLAGNLRDAERYLQQYLAEAPDAVNADEVVDTIVQIQQKIAAELATIQVETGVRGRGVWVDDDAEPSCTTPCSVTVPPGPRRITIRGKDAVELVEELTLEPGQTFQLKTSLRPATPMGRLMVSTDRTSAQLEIADRVEGLPLQHPLELEAGEYVVAVQSNRRAKWSGQVNVAADETTRVYVPMQGLVEAQKRGGVRRAIAYSLWGGSVAAATGGALLGVQARNTYRQLEADEASNQFVQKSLVSQGKAQQAGANIMFAVATTAAITGITLFLWDTLTE